MTQKTVVIIGAGIGGIATANLLAKAGYRVDVYEKNAQAGGRAGLLKIDGFTFDTGPSWYLMPEVFEHYYSLLEKTVDGELELTRLDPAYKVFFEHQPPVVITSNLDQDVETFESIEPGSGEKLRDYVTRSDNIYQLSLRHFLYSNFSSLKDFVSKDIVKNSLRMLSLAFTPIDTYVKKFVRDQRLKQILEYPMVFLGTSPFQAPAIYSLMSALDFKEGVFYPMGGVYKIIESLQHIGSELGVRFHYDSPVNNIYTQDGEATGIKLSDGTLVKADIVISNADLHHTETTMLDPIDQSFPAKYWSKKQAGPSALLMYLGVTGSLPQLQHHNLLFVDEWKQNFDDIYTNKKLPDPASIYICKPSATDPNVAPAGNENVFVLVPLPAGVSVKPSDLESLADRYLKQIEQMSGITDLTSRVVSRALFGPDDFLTKFHSWQSSALGPAHILRQSAFFRTTNQSRKVKNLYYVGGSTTPGIGLPMCLISAELVYKRLIGDKRSGPVSKIKATGKL